MFASVDRICSLFFILISHDSPISFLVFIKISCEILKDEHSHSALPVPSLSGLCLPLFFYWKCYDYTGFASPLFCSPIPSSGHRILHLVYLEDCRILARSCFGPEILKQNQLSSIFSSGSCICWSIFGINLPV